jgi:radical SAM protein with 4Fe4S-binding SPASM domain
MGIIERVKGYYAKKQPLTRGFHAYRGNLADGTVYRMHLRVEGDGSGVLVINAAKVLHLNQTGVEYVKLMIDGLEDLGVVKTMASRYRVGKKQAEEDFKAFKEKILCLVKSDEVCPVESLEFSRIQPFSMPVSAPYRMDLALTHRCDLNCGHCYAGGPREMKELDTAAWKKVLEKLFSVGIPHVCFTGGEATLRDDLPDLIARAEDLGLVTGLLTNGCRLADPEFVKRLIAEGLDHVQITIESGDKAIHNEMVKGEGFDRTKKGIENALGQGLYTVTNTTITRKNIAGLTEIVRFLHQLGVQRFAMNGVICSGRGAANPDLIPAPEMEEALDRVVETASELGMNFIWYTPTRYCEFDPVAHGLGMKRCTAGHFNMCIEPDGSVIPCQSCFEPVGNILHDEWEKIWNAPRLSDLRERGWVDEECRNCDQLEICGGGCPLEKEGKEILCTESLSNF